MGKRITRSYVVNGQQVHERVATALLGLTTTGSTRAVRDAAQAAVDDSDPTLAQVTALVTEATSGATEADQLAAIERLGLILAANTVGEP